MPAKFGRRPFPHLSVTLFTEWQMEQQNEYMISVDNYNKRQNPLKTT